MKKADVIKIINEQLLNEAPKPNDVKETYKILNATYREFSKAAKEYIKAIKFNGFKSEGDHLASLLNSGVGGFMIQVKQQPVKRK